MASSNHQPGTSNVSRREFIRKFQISGYTVKNEAFAILEGEFICASPPYESIEEFIKRVTLVIVNEFACDTSVIDRQLGEQVVKRLQEDSGRRQVSHELLVRNVIIPEVKEIESNNGNEADGRGDVTSHHAHCRLLRSRLESFLCKMKENNSDQIDTYELMTVGQLQNTYRGTIACHVLGFMGKDRSKLRQFWLEDDCGRVELNWSNNVERRSVILLENTFVLVEGVYHSLANQLLVERIGYLPPAIVYPQSMLPPADPPSSDQSDINMFVLLRDVHLDKKEVLSKLQILFAGFDAVTPTPHFFVFIGPFASRTLARPVYLDLLRLMLRLICSCTNLPQRSHFIFVPGPADGNNTSIREPEANVQELLPDNSQLKLHFTTNPVHLFVDEHQLCIFSANYFDKARKRMMFSQSVNEEDMPVELLRLIPSNAYLLPSHHQHINSSLVLHSLPDLLLYCENSLNENPEVIDMQITPRCHLLGLPSFSRHQYRFKVFYPETRTVEHSQITV